MLVFWLAKAESYYAYIQIIVCSNANNIGVICSPGGWRFAMDEFERRDPERSHG